MLAASMKLHSQLFYADIIIVHLQHHTVNRKMFTCVLLSRETTGRILMEFGELGL